VQDEPSGDPEHLEDGDLEDANDLEDPEHLDDLDDLDGVETSMSRLVARARGWLALVVVIALVVPFGGWLVDEFAFGSAGSEVEEQLGTDAALADALLLVRSSDCAGRTTTGSAFAVELDGTPVVVTNRHVVEDARTIGVRRLAGGTALQVASHRVSEERDVAVLELVDAAGLPPALTVGDTVVPGDEVRVVGFPAGRPDISSGPVQEAAPGRLVLDLEIDPGASGSPVLDDAGRVVGQVYARTTEGRGVATPLGDLLAAARTAKRPAPCD
jgi:S1-C subfamily serine protease